MDFIIKNEAIYDYKYDILDIDVEGNFKYKHSIELDNGVYLDFDKNNSPFVLEILDASRIFNIDKKDFNNLSKIILNIKIKNDLIQVKIDFSYISREKTIKDEIIKNITNKFNLPNMETSIATI